VLLPARSAVVASRRPSRRAQALWGLVLAPWLSVAGAQELIAHSSVTAAHLERAQARLLFTLRRERWDDALPVRVFVLPDEHPVHRAFAQTVLDLFPYQLRRVWDRQLFSGTGQAPVTVADEAEMLARVAATPGAIGYVGTFSPTSGVHAVPVD